MVEYINFFCVFQCNSNQQFCLKNSRGGIFDLRYSRLLAKYELGNELKVAEIKEAVPRNDVKEFLGSNDKNICTVKEKSKSVFEELKKIKLRDVKVKKPLKKKETSSFSTFSKIDSYFEKNIRYAFGFTIEDNEENKIYKQSLRNSSFKKFLFIHTPPILILSLAIILFYPTIFVFVIIFLFSLSTTVVSYIFIKALKYVWIELRKYKHGIKT
ncbi:Plasmodium exported protein (Pm-fam-a like), unknown function [Plasmodium ovale wallikeri]|uniref:Uncharacterized protein n=1 Tax=Plasmodium ovale wallikeri TaxID=864142 RepID=A0A1A9APU5_PLAOA|nr:Plasmodium exported protein (Pm-fam-a like), unknown function [Plasmodium ovale wallikeri]